MAESGEILFGNARGHFLERKNRPWPFGLTRHAEWPSPPLSALAGSAARPAGLIQH